MFKIIKTTVSRGAWVRHVQAVTARAQIASLVLLHCASRSGARSSFCALPTFAQVQRADALTSFETCPIAHAIVSCLLDGRLTPELLRSLRSRHGRAVSRAPHLIAQDQKQQHPEQQLFTERRAAQLRTVQTCLLAPASSCHWHCHLWARAIIASTSTRTMRATSHAPIASTASTTSTPNRNNC